MYMYHNPWCLHISIAYLTTINIHVLEKLLIITPFEFSKIEQQKNRGIHRNSIIYLPARFLFPFSSPFLVWQLLNLCLLLAGLEGGGVHPQLGPHSSTSLPLCESVLPKCAYTCIHDCLVLIYHSTYVHLLGTIQIKRATIWIFLIKGKTHAWIQKFFQGGYNG